MARGQTRFTEKLIEGSATSGAKDRLMFDVGCPGLGLRVTTASKTFLVQWTDRATGGKQREVIGQWGALTLD